MHTFSSQACVHKHILKSAFALTPHLLETHQHRASSEVVCFNVNISMELPFKVMLQVDFF